MKTPMEREFPTICEWTRHGAVSTDRLREELLRALASIASPWPPAVWVSPNQPSDESEQR